MFQFKHEIELVSSEKIKLFGEDYFCDKRKFWEFHQNTLLHLYERVFETGFPIKITDLVFNKLIVIENMSSFRSWLKLNQPFNFDKIMSDRLNTLYAEIIEKCNQLNCFEFEFYWEMWGVLWCPWCLEINGKSQSFSFNDVSYEDLDALIKNGLIVLIKEYTQEEMDDEFDRKRYRVLKDDK
ncbi:hypothetical protein [Tenacibaculum sp. M341]|uniref:hypothetical protein n=1 Tax=Tenacibaculum sp. M341 TaxID=2530339 RepID=UPI001049B02E|nr:hypothetical protein [Tenacibaculum sp. M341]TCI91800.1 hypothetical protein EYW44_09615 [Tenacibaculum sp. M341]